MYFFNQNLKKINFFGGGGVGGGGVYYESKFKIKI